MHSALRKRSDSYPNLNLQPSAKEKEALALPQDYATMEGTLIKANAQDYINLLKSKMMSHTDNSDIVVPIIFNQETQKIYTSLGLNHVLEGMKTDVGLQVIAYFGNPPNCHINTSPTPHLIIPADKIAILLKKYCGAEEKSEKAAHNILSAAQASLPYSQAALLSDARRDYAPAAGPAKQSEQPPNASSKEEPASRDNRP